MHRPRSISEHRRMCIEEGTRFITVATGGDTAITLTIADQSQYTWQATPKGKPPIEIKGNLIASSEAVVLENQEHGSMVGKVTSGGPDKFTFNLRGMPPSDPGLALTRKKP